MITPRGKACSMAWVPAAEIDGDVPVTVTASYKDDVLCRDAIVRNGWPPGPAMNTFIFDLTFGHGSTSPVGVTASTTVVRTNNHLSPPTVTADGGAFG